MMNSNRASWRLKLCNIRDVVAVVKRFLFGLAVTARHAALSDGTGAGALRRERRLATRNACELAQAAQAMAPKI